LRRLPSNVVINGGDDCGRSPAAGWSVGCPAMVDTVKFTPLICIRPPTTTRRALSGEFSATFRFATGVQLRTTENLQTKNKMKE